MFTMPVKVPEPVDDPVEDLGRLLVHMGPDEVARFVARLPGEYVPLLDRALGRISTTSWRSTPAAMAAHLTERSFRPVQRWGYVELLSDAYRRAVTGESIRQIWNLPARYGKSTIGSQWGSVWALDRHPWIKLALTSYGDELANENATIVRDLLIEHGDSLSVRLRKDRRRNDRFVTEEGGGLIAAGVGSGLTGFGAHGIVVDDPFKNWQEAHSPARRALVWNWFRSVVRLRLESETAFLIVVMTRWHEDDLAGMLEAADIAGDGEGWEIIRLPALAEAPDPDSLLPSLRLPDPLGRAPGEPLEPLRFSLAAVTARATALGSYLAAGLEQQRPSPEEGGEIMRAWWQWATAPPPRFDDSLTSWDMKMKDKKGGDYVVGQTWGRTGSSYWCVDQLRGQWNMATTKAAIALMGIRHPKVKRHVIENTGNGPEVMEQLRAPQKGYVVSEAIAGELGMSGDERRSVERLLRRGMSGLLPENPKGDKVARVRAQSPLIEAGNVHLLDRAWARSIVDESAAFPRGAHDDQVDAWSQALKRLSHLGTASTAPAPARKVETKPDRKIGTASTGAPRALVTRASTGRAGARSTKPGRRPIG
jgi:phage terminase large subunit-like protein